MLSALLWCKYSRCQNCFYAVEETEGLGNPGICSRTSNFYAAELKPKASNSFKFSKIVYKDSTKIPMSKLPFLTRFSGKPCLLWRRDHAQGELWFVKDNERQGSGILSRTKSLSIVFSTRSKEREELVTGLHATRCRLIPPLKAGNFKVRRSKMWR